MTKIIQISDTHIVPKGQLAYEQVDTRSALEATVETINGFLDKIGPVDLVFITGDLTEHGFAEEYQIIRDILGDLKVPYRAVPGNHDRRSTMQEQFGAALWMPCDGYINWSVDFSDFAVIGLDSLVEGAAYGSLASETLLFLDQSLATLDGKPVIIGLHHPPFEVGIRDMDVQNLKDAGKLAERLSSYAGEIRLACGHVHRFATSLFAGQICQIAPGTSHAVTLDQREAAGNSLTIEPGGFVLHEWRNGHFVSHLIPVGTFAGPYPFLGV